MEKNLTLTGMMGVGKTTIGKRLAKKLNYAFVDIDKIIEKQEGESISSIFKNKGEDYFRKLETRCLKELLKFKSCVISCGGGTPCFNKNMEIITLAGASIYIKLSPTVLFNRLKLEKDQRPLIADMEDSKMFSYIQKKLNERKIFYEKAEFIFSADSEKDESIISLINGFLN